MTTHIIFSALQRMDPLQVLVDESAEAADASVDTRSIGGSASLAPRDNTDQNTGARVDERAARVTLAGVLATSGETSADHVVSDSRGSVRGAAGSTGHDGNIDLPEGGGKSRAAGGGGAPMGRKVSLLQ